jgi:hypothetical protein
MKCFTIEGYLVLRNGIELQNCCLVLGEQDRGREENIIEFEEQKIRIMDEYYKKIYHFFYRAANLLARLLSLKELGNINLL